MANTEVTLLIRKAIWEAIRQRLISNGTLLWDFAKRLGVSHGSFTMQLNGNATEKKLEEIAEKAGFMPSEIENIKREVITDHIEPRGSSDDPDHDFAVALKTKYGLSSADPRVMADIDLAIRIALGKAR